MAPTTTCLNLGNKNLPNSPQPKWKKMPPTFYGFGDANYNHPDDVICNIG